MNKYIFLAGAVFIIGLVIFILRFIIGGPEDTWICRQGNWVKHGNPLAPKPTSFCETPPLTIEGSSPAPVTGEPNIQVFSPRFGDSIGLPLIVTGRARVFENNFNYRLKDADGKIIAQGNGTSQATDAGQYGPFTLSINYPAPKTERGTLEVYDLSAKDGAENDLIAVPIIFSKVEATNIKVFFGNKVKDPQSLKCNVTYPVIRRVAKVATIGQSALEELLKGPTPEEASAGAVSSINPGTKLNELTITNGTAKVDFDTSLGNEKCSITAQITETLKQFPTVKQVLVSVNGQLLPPLSP